MEEAITLYYITYSRLSGGSSLVQVACQICGMVSDARVVNDLEVDRFEVPNKNHQP